MSKEELVVEIDKVYKHYKGNYYRVVAIGKNTETMEDMVVYSPISDPTMTWIRPLKMWFDVIDEEKNITRFERVDN